VFIIQDSNSIVVRKGFVPAPPAGSTNLVGINNLSTAQTNAILSAGEKIGTDDPIPVAYLLTILRSDGVTENDAVLIAELGKFAIVGAGGFEETLLNSGVTAAQLADFKSYLVYNPTAGKKTLRDLTASFKTAVDSEDTTTAKQEMQKAGGFMADVFMDAASSAGIDYTLILAAHDAAGEVAEAHNDIITQLTANVQSSMNQSMSAFFQRIAAIKVKGEYTKALNTLNASGTQVDAFNAAVNAMMTAMGNIDSDYADFFNDPQGYCTAQGKSFNTVQGEVDARYQAAFAAFQNAIAASNPDIAAMKTNVETAFGVTGMLPLDFGTYIDFTGTPKNWPIPQVVMVNWMALNVIATGGSLTYTRDTLAIPTHMQEWMGTCANPGAFNKTACEAIPAVWTPGRHDYSATTPSASFNAYLGLMEDIQIIENARYAIYWGGATPTREEEKANRLLFQERMGDAAGRIGGTTDGTTAITGAQKDAIIKLLMQPSMD